MLFRAGFRSEEDPFGRQPRCCRLLRQQTLATSTQRTRFASECKNCEVNLPGDRTKAIFSCSAAGTAEEKRMRPAAAAASLGTAARFASTRTGRTTTRSAIHPTGTSCGPTEPPVPVLRFPQLPPSLPRLSRRRPSLRRPLLSPARLSIRRGSKSDARERRGRTSPGSDAQ